MLTWAGDGSAIGEQRSLEIDPRRGIGGVSQRLMERFSRLFRKPHADAKIMVRDGDEPPEGVFDEAKACHRPASAEFAA
jgi:hypothetical protein